MRSVAGLSLDLFLLGHAHLAAGQTGDGAGFERRVRAHLDSLGLPSTAGFRVFGSRSLSGLYHQLDSQTSCQEALVVGEWKTYTGSIPKNELLRFKAVTDDYWLAGNVRQDLPLIRIFGGTGTVTEAMRIYAAQWGIILITPGRWPVPAICDPDLLWSPGEQDHPAPADLRTLVSLIRPLNLVLALQEDGSWKVPPIPSARDMAARLRLWEHWSERAWNWWDDMSHGRFDALLEGRTGQVAAA